MEIVSGEYKADIKKEIACKSNKNGELKYDEQYSINNTE
jgi:hypothetical protein